MGNTHDCSRVCFDQPDVPRPARPHHTVGAGGLGPYFDCCGAAGEIFRNYARAGDRSRKGARRDRADCTRGACQSGDRGVSRGMGYLTATVTLACVFMLPRVTTAAAFPAAIPVGTVALI